jgi:hypothetical protein
VPQRGLPILGIPDLDREIREHRERMSKKPHLCGHLLVKESDVAGAEPREYRCFWCGVDPGAALMSWGISPGDLTPDQREVLEKNAVGSGLLRWVLDELRVYQWSHHYCRPPRRAQRRAAKSLLDLLRRTQEKIGSLESTGVTDDLASAAFQLREGLVSGCWPWWASWRSDLKVLVLAAERLVDPQEKGPDRRRIALEEGVVKGLIHFGIRPPTNRAVEIFETALEAATGKTLADGERVLRQRVHAMRANGAIPAEPRPSKLGRKNSTRNRT